MYWLYPYLRRKLSEALSKIVECSLHGFGIDIRIFNIAKPTALCEVLLAVASARERITSALPSIANSEYPPLNVPITRSIRVFLMRGDI